MKVLGMVLLSEPVPTEELKGALERAGWAPSEGPVLSVESEEGTLFVTPVPSSLPGEGLLNNVHPMLTDEAEIPAIGNHGAHVIVVAASFGGDDDRASRRRLHQLHARGLRALADDERVVGYAIEGTTVGPAALRAELADSSHPPLHLWAPAWVWLGEQRVTAYTFGLAAFGHPEIQIVDADIDVAEAYVLLNDVAGYVISGVDLEPGATVGFGNVGEVGVDKRPWLVDTSRPAWQLKL